MTTYVQHVDYPCFRQMQFAIYHNPTIAFSTSNDLPLNAGDFLVFKSFDDENTLSNIFFITQVIDVDRNGDAVLDFADSQNLADFPIIVR